MTMPHAGLMPYVVPSKKYQNMIGHRLTGFVHIAFWLLFPAVASSSKKTCHPSGFQLMDTCNKHLRSSWDAHTKSKEFIEKGWARSIIVRIPTLVVQSNSQFLCPPSLMLIVTLSHYTLPALSTFHGGVGNGTPSELQPRVDCQLKSFNTACATNYHRSNVRNLSTSAPK